MFRPVEDPAAVAEAPARAHQVLAGSGDLSADWLQDGARIALPEESALHLDADQRARLAAALAGARVGELLAVVVEPLEVGPTVFTLDASEDDLAEFSHECGLFSVVLLPRVGDRLAVLCSVDDYLLVAGPRSFVTAYAGDLAVARTAYLAYVEAHFDSARAALRAVAYHLDRL